MLDSHGQPVLAQTASGTVGAAYTFDAKNPCEVSSYRANT